MTLYTVGHSTHPIEVFLAFLARHEIAILADVRSYPASRRWPQFNRETLAHSITDAGREYRWLQALGGRRHSKQNASPHTAWKVAAFRAYADYADGPAFAEGLAELIASASARRTAIMCSEGLWWRCHRRIISDQMTIRGWEVIHILPDGKLVAHTLPDFARRDGERLIYDAGQPPLDLS
ncbi:MAG TPA: DUF488 domain-containing protein [Candidatus Binataceae bacterium]|nr:DUF488 domain-containing protein [Candidatus Binataceae bacterium]